MFEVRSFLGLAYYYIFFIKDFAAIAIPISVSIGENKCVSRHRSRNIPEQFSEKQLQAFHKLE